METMGDGNGIYIRGAGAGNVIRRNYIHHLVTPMIMQAAIRTDGGQRDTLIAENLIYKCMAQGHHFEAEQSLRKQHCRGHPRAAPRLLPVAARRSHDGCGYQAKHLLFLSKEYGLHR